MLRFFLPCHVGISPGAWIKPGDVQILQVIVHQFLHDLWWVSWNSLSTYCIYMACIWHIMACIGGYHPVSCFSRSFCFERYVVQWSSCNDNLGKPREHHHPKPCAREVIKVGFASSPKSWTKVVEALRAILGMVRTTKPKPLMLNTLQGTDTYITYPSLEQSSWQKYLGWGYVNLPGGYTPED